MKPGQDEQPLVFNVAGLLGEAPGSSRDLPFSAVRMDFGEELVQDGPLAGSAHVVRTNRGLLVRAAFTTSLSDTCSRCLRPISVPLDLELDEEVLPILDIATGLPLDTAAEPETSRLSDHHELDLETLLREAIQLATPIAPLCRPDCRGLCPECGADLNEGPHGHGEGPLDPRLEALRAFRVDEEG